MQTDRERQRDGDRQSDRQTEIERHREMGWEEHTGYILNQFQLPSHVWSTGPITLNSDVYETITITNG